MIKWKTPKNFSRKGKICSCLCPVLRMGDKKFFDILIENVIVKYEVEPNQTTSYIHHSLKKNQWSTYEYWGEFKQVIELPEIFSKLDKEDYTIKTGTFTRDNIQMPCVAEILILNIDKYLKIKNREERRNKLNKIKNI
jgi:hypothetical protein